MDKKIFLVLLALSFAPPSWAYDDVTTHPDMTRAAVDKSVASPNAGLMRDLGLTSWVGNPQFPFYLGRGAPRYLIAEGVRLEDEIPRPRHHFYDPVYQRPLTIAGIALGQMSLIWALDFDNDMPGQDFALSDARRYMYQALTTPGPKEVRDQHWANTFLALGHVIHHIQDMAQPQHARNDEHLDRWVPPPIYQPSRYEAYTKDSRGRVQELASSGQVQAAFPGAPELKLPRHFWVNDAQSGMAEFSNRNFVSHGTNFEMRGDQVVTPLYPQPTPGTPTDYTLEELYGAPELVPPHMASLCGGQGIACIMTMYPSIGPTLTVAKASTLSIYDQDLHSRGLEVIYDRWDEDIHYVVTRLFALNHFNFDEAQRVLIPRTVSYSAGFINYFFRGKLEITPPALGAYAVADHSRGEGFTTIKAKVKNVTPGEAMRGGTVVAVVKYRRNGCYRPDLSGEFELSGSGRLIPPPCREGESYLSNEEFIITSAEQTLTLGSGDQQELTFALSEPLPFAATDVYLQVVYKGVLGDEPRSIAVGTADISEPTYLSIFNGTDVFVIPDSFNRGTPFYWTVIRDNITRLPYSVVDLDQDGNYLSPPDVYIDGRSLNFEVFLDGGKIADLLALPEGRFARIALLVSSSTFNVRVRFGGYYDYHYPGLPPKLGRINWERRVYEVSGLWRDRNRKLQWLAPFYYYYYRTPVYDPEYFLLLESRVPDATQPVSAVIPDALAGSVRLASGGGGVYDRPRQAPVERIVPRAVLTGENGGPRAFRPAEALRQ